MVSLLTPFSVATTMTFWVYESLFVSLIIGANFCGIIIVGHEYVYIKLYRYTLAVHNNHAEPYFPFIR